MDPKLKTAYDDRGFAWRQKSEYDKAIDDCNEAIRLDPKFASAFNNRGWAWERKENHDKAIADFGEAIRLDPKPPFRTKIARWRGRRRGTTARPSPI